MTVRKHIYFSGQVQGVGFRYRARFLAQRLGLTGWVGNLDDGRVEMELQGESPVLREFLVELRRQPYIQVEDVEITDLPLDREERTFRVKDYFWES